MKMNKSKILHAMIRVSDMERSIKFYIHFLGMKVLRKLDQPEDGYSLCFLGYSEESESCALELTYNYGVSEYAMGNAYGHIAISVNNCSAACKEIKNKGGVVVLEPSPLKGSNEIIAFISDPDGYQIELIQR